MMSVETEQRHLQMLLTVSSFGESLRRYDKRSAEAFLNGLGWKIYFFPTCAGWGKTGKTIKNELPFPAADSTQIRP